MQITQEARERFVASGERYLPQECLLCLYFVELEYASARFGNLMPCAQRKVAMAHLT
jgi:hypothetical protein